VPSPAPIPGRDTITSSQLRLVGALAFGGAGLAFVVVAAGALAGYSDPALTRSGFAHFDNTPVQAQLINAVHQVADSRRLTGGSVFIVRKDAAFLYLTSGLRNPLPYDIPEVSDLGAGGEPGVIKLLRRGDAPWVCIPHVDPPVPDPSRPLRLEHWVRRHFDEVRGLGACVLYHHPSRRPANG
jgi:hypothetical protein